MLGETIALLTEQEVLKREDERYDERAKKLFEQLARELRSIDAHKVYEQGV